MSAGLLLNWLRADATSSMGASAVVSLGRLAAAVALARLCDITTFAQFVWLSTALMITVNSANALIISPMINLTQRVPLSGRGSFVRLVRKRLGRVVGLFVFALALATPAALALDISAPAYVGFAATLILTNLALLPRGYLQVTFRTRWILFADLLAIGVTAVATAVAWNQWNAPFAGFWIGSALGQAVQLGLLSATTRKWCADNDRPPQELIDEMHAAGWHMFGGSLACSAGSRMQPFVLGIAADSLAVAAYGAANSLVGPLRMLSAGLASVVRPRLARHASHAEHKAYRRCLRAVLTALALVGTLGVAIALAFGELLLGVVFGAQVACGSTVVALALLWGTLDALTSMLMIALQIELKKGAARATRIRVESAALSLALMVPACLWLGVTGAFASLAAAEIWYAGRAMSQLRVADGLFSKLKHGTSWKKAMLAGS